MKLFAPHTSKGLLFILRLYVFVGTLMVLLIFLSVFSSRNGEMLNEFNIFEGLLFLILLFGGGFLWIALSIVALLNWDKFQSKTVLIMTSALPWLVLQVITLVIIMKSF